MTFTELLSKFRGPARRQPGGGYTVFCPAHADGKKSNRQSLSIKQGEDGKPLLHCFAGCASVDVLAAVGLTFRDIMPTPAQQPPREVVATYDYCDGAGALLYQVVRFAPKDFRQRRPDGRGGWIWTLGEVERVPYRLAQIAGHYRVYWCEGEKDADNLAEAFRVATTTGAGGAKAWRNEYATQLAGVGVREVVILPDNDPPGREYARTVAAACNAALLVAHIVQLPGLPEKGDVSDWLAQGNHTLDELEALIRKPAAEEPTPQAPDEIIVRDLREYLNVDPALLRVEYLLKPYLVANGLNAITAMPGSGKGKFAQGLAMARAYGLPFCGLPTAPGPTIFWSGEQGFLEDARVYQAIGRGLAHGLPDPLHRIITISDPGLHLNKPAMLNRVLELVRTNPNALVMTDSIRRAVPGEENDSIVPDTFFREVFLPVRGAGGHMLLLGHPPKSPPQGELRLESMIRGSGDWLAILDSMVVLKEGGRTSKAKGEEDISDILVHVKARRGRKADPVTWTMHVKDDDTDNVSFTFSMTDAPEGVSKAQLVVEALALLMQEKGTATRPDIQAVLCDKKQGKGYSKGQVWAAIQNLEQQNVITRCGEGRKGRPHYWKWGKTDEANSSQAGQQETI
ncbi:MAG TPA: AAA family ATPase [Gemmatimonadales bacterium]|nr:AAA family ATPase [Gemmatimonadales bacterium]